jgi:hypothetical protein
VEGDVPVAAVFPLFGEVEVPAGGLVVVLAALPDMDELVDPVVPGESVFCVAAPEEVHGCVVKDREFVLSHSSRRLGQSCRFRLFRPSACTCRTGSAGRSASPSSAAASTATSATSALRECESAACGEHESRQDGDQVI